MCRSYRQQDPFAQLGWSPNRSTLCQIVSTSADLLLPLVTLLTERVLAASVINTDDTPVTLLTPREDPGSRKARLTRNRELSRQQSNRYSTETSPERAVGSKLASLLHILWRK